MLKNFRAKGVWNSALKWHVKSSNIFNLQEIEKVEKIAYAGITILMFLSNMNLKCTVS